MLSLEDECFLFLPTFFSECCFGKKKNLPPNNSDKKKLKSVNKSWRWYCISRRVNDQINNSICKGYIIKVPEIEEAIDL